MFSYQPHTFLPKRQIIKLLLLTLLSLLSSYNRQQCTIEHQAMCVAILSQLTVPLIPCIVISSRILLSCLRKVHLFGFVN